MSFFLGRSGFITTEDEYSDGIKLSLTSSFNAAPSPQEVIIKCQNKNRRVCSYLSSPIKFSGKANWKEMFGGGLGSAVGTGISALNNIAQYFKGVTIQQPWMNKKLYQSTNPISFTLDLNFVAEEDAKADVWDPLVALLSFVYPRLLQGSGTFEKTDKVTGVTTKTTYSGDMNALGYLGAATGNEYCQKQATIYQTPNDSKSSIATNDAGVVAAAANLCKLYSIPGPGLREGYGDKVEVIIGKYMAFSDCYVENVDIELGNVMNSDGYPLQGNAKVTVVNSTSNVVKWVGDDYQFFISGFEDSGKEVDEFMKVLGNRASKVAETFSNVTEKLGSFYKNFSTFGS